MQVPFGRQPATETSWRFSLVLLLPLLPILAISCVSARAGDPYTQLMVGTDYSAGDYNDPIKTSISSLPISLKVARGHWIYRVATSYIHLRGPGNLIDTSGDGGTGNGTGGDVTTPTPGRRNIAGMGDIILSTTYDYEVPGKNIYLDLTGKVKVPVASARDHLGTGLVDTTLAAEVSKVFGKLAVYGGGRYRLAGHSRAFPLRNTSGYDTGLSYNASKKVSLLLDYSWVQSSYVYGLPISAVTALATYKVNPGFRIQAYCSRGLTRNTADTSIGVQFVIRFYGRGKPV